MIDFIQDDDKLREERKKAKKNKDKYIGMSSEAMGMKMGSAGYNDSTWDSNRKDDRNWCKYHTYYISNRSLSLELFYSFPFALSYRFVVRYNKCRKTKAASN